MEIILGIDQGSSSTRAAVCTLDGHLLGYGSAPGACHGFQGMPRAMQVVQEAVAAALAQANARREDVRLVFGGLTGADWPDEYPLLQGNIRSTLGIENVTVTNDSIIAMRGGTERSYGAILIAGSGGNCAIRAPDGRQFIYGYYHEPALQGGGALGRHALDAIYQAEVGLKPATRLTQRVLTLFGLKNADQLMRAEVEQRLPGKGILDLAPLIFEEAALGDWAAVRILRNFGKGSARLVTHGLRRFHMTGIEVDVVLSGSVFKGQGTLLVDTIAKHIHKVAPRARLVNARYEPVVGAVLLGLEKARAPFTAKVRAAIEESALKFGLVRSSRWSSSAA
jgi:N-acetylglucosamine kinase-like BadF-type ATPase